MCDSFLGIDIAKEKFDVHLFKDKQRWSGEFENSEKGFKQLSKWLKKRKVGRLHACMEATGSYGEPLAEYLYAQKIKVSVVNPKIIKHYGHTKMQRNKTDKLDARLIEAYCRKETPRAWEPLPEEQQMLKAMSRRLESLKQDKVREQNRLKAKTHPLVVQASIEATINFYQAQIVELEQQIEQHIDQHPDSLGQVHQLLTSINGIGDTSATLVMAELPDFTLFQSSKQVTAYAGLSPRQLQSGKMHRNGGIYKLGSRRLRKALYFPAITGKTHNPILKAMAQRLEDRGVTGMPMVAALMRKMLVLVYGVLKTKQPFDPDFVVNVQAAAAKSQVVA